MSRVSLTINVDIGIWQVPLFVTMFVTSVCNYGCPMYLVIQSFVPRLYPITLMYDLESVWFQRLMYLMYTLDMFYILNFAIVLWIYGTLNKMKWNEMKISVRHFKDTVFLWNVRHQSPGLCGNISQKNRGLNHTATKTSRLVHHTLLIWCSEFICIYLSCVSFMYTISMMFTEA